MILELNKATMPNTNVLFVDVDGMSADLASRFAVNVQRVSLNPFTFNRPTVYAATESTVKLWRCMGCRR